METGNLNLAEIEDQPVEAAGASLTKLKGIGAWTADAYLLSASRRPDMWPVGDGRSRLASVRWWA